MTTFIQKPALQLIKQPTSFKLVVEEHLERIIRHICARYPKNEWSGTLFYTVEGTFEDNNLVIHAKDFYVQDIGGGAYTEFKNDASLAGYMVEHELWGCYTGLMHSHNTMATFFSGTDTSTLQSEGTEQNHFVSLIINNEGTYTAAITRKVKGTKHEITKGTETLTYKSFGDEVKTIDNRPIHKENTAEVEYIEYYMLNIEVERVPYERGSLDLRLDELQQSANSYINRNKVGVSTNTAATQSSVANPPVRTLFDNDETFMATPAKKVTENMLDYETLHIEEAMVISHVKQFITLNLFAGNNPKVDLKQWGENMTKLMSRRFPNIADYEYTIEALVDILYTEISHSKYYAEWGDECTAAVWANDVITYIMEHITPNAYTNVIINNMERWII